MTMRTADIDDAQQRTNTGARAPVAMAGRLV
jgi:hypothetical protein